MLACGAVAFQSCIAAVNSVWPPPVTPFCPRVDGSSSHQVTEAEALFVHRALLKFEQETPPSGHHRLSHWTESEPAAPIGLRSVRSAAK